MMRYRRYVSYDRQRSDNLGQIVDRAFDPERSLTLVCNNLHDNGKSMKLDLLEAFKSELVELWKSGKDDSITLLSFLSHDHEPAIDSCKSLSMES
jgi:hypothetical protein